MNTSLFGFRVLDQIFGAMGEAAEKAILQYLEHHDEIADSEAFARERDIPPKQMDSATKSLQGFEFIAVKESKTEYWELTAEATSYCKLGSPEVQVYNAVPPAGSISMAALKEKLLDAPFFQVGFQAAAKNGWLKPGKEAIIRKVSEVEDVVKQQLCSLADQQELDLETVKALQKRKLISLKVRRSCSLAKGPKYAPKRLKEATDLTRDMLQKETWPDAKFKAYNFEALGQPTEGGYLHPLLKVRAKIMRIFLDMGFAEMPTNNYVESSFWNFDTLFQPQQHPARDSHDTFFLKSPATCTVAPEDYMLRVKSVHEEGGYGSSGYGYNWKLEEAEKNVLRTHTTAVSSRMLYKLAQDGFAAKRYFSIDRVFRNEAVDRTHLAEFHQIEGLICDKGLTLGDLIGVLHDFFIRLGIKNLRFKPAYNPYTEPSMEIFSYHEQLKKWVEVGNSGMFRPEMLLPMGLPEDVSVIAWGLSLERPTMILYGIDNIRDLFGHKVDLKLIKSNPICRLGAL